MLHALNQLKSCSMNELNDTQRGCKIMPAGKRPKLESHEVPLVALLTQFRTSSQLQQWAFNIGRPSFVGPLSLQRTMIRTIHQSQIVYYIQIKAHLYFFVTRVLYYDECNYTTCHKHAVNMESQTTMLCWSQIQTLSAVSPAISTLTLSERWSSNIKCGGHLESTLAASTCSLVEKSQGSLWW